MLRLTLEVLAVLAGGVAGVILEAKFGLSVKAQAVVASVKAFFSDKPAGG